MTKESSIGPIEKATNKSWDAWVAKIAEVGAAKVGHTELARAVRTILDDPEWAGETMNSNRNWWAQNIAVTYEQKMGRRKAGQQSDGMYAANVSRTLDANSEELFDRWCKLAQNLETADFRTSRTPKRLYWRTTADDQTKSEISFEQKPDGKVLVAAYQSKLPNDQSVAQWKKYWSEKLKEL